jgi:deoxyribonuclease-1
MKRDLKFVGLAIVMMSNWTFAQNFQKWKISTSAVNFGSVLSQQNSEQGFWIYNLDQNENLEVVINVSDSFFKSSFTKSNIPVLDSVYVKMIFRPVYNIRYQSLALISTNRLPGIVPITLIGDGKYTEAYYNSTFNLWDEDLKIELGKITGQGYVSLGYNTARDYMYGTIDNKSGWVTCVYTGRKAQFGTRSEATANSFNCEHTWPQSLFSSNEPMKSDIHHLYSTDETANSRRDNDPFGVVLNSTWSAGGSKSNGSLFEPRDEQKGNSARSTMYMAMRYQNYSNFLNGQEAILRTWNKQFPPDQEALARNNAIFGYQKNRNPFVDHSDFLDRISSLSNTSTRPLVFNYWYQGSTNQMENWPIVKRVIKDTLDVIVYNSGTGVINITNVTPPQNGKIAGLYVSQLNAGSFTTIRFTEDAETVMSKTYQITTDKGNYTDSLHFEIQSTGNTFELATIKSAWFPTPSSNGIFYFSNSSSKTEVKVYNNKGQLVLFTELSSELNEIDLSTMPNGIYFVESLQANGRTTQKLVLQK